MTRELGGRVSFLVAVSLSALWFAPTWQFLFNGAYLLHVSLARGSDAPLYIGALIAFAFTTLVLTGVLLSLRRLPRVGGTLAALTVWVCVLLLFRWLRKYSIIPLGSVRPLLMNLSAVGWILGVCLAVAGTVLFVKKFRVLSSSLVAVLMMMSPIGVIVGAQLVYRAIRSNAETARDTTGRSWVRDASRLVVIVFDELDARDLEQAMSQGALPAFQAFREQAVWAERARAPATLTALSIPALLSGQPVTQVYGVGEARTTVRFAGGPAMAWGHAARDLLGSTAALRRPVGVVGWYHSYCENFEGKLARCRSFAERQLPYSSGGALKAAWVVIRSNADLFAAIQKAAFQRSQQMTSEAVRLAGDPALQLIWIHHVLPHAPWLDERAGYRGNLSAADSVLSQIRWSMERAGLWNSSAVVVTSDHGVRLRGYTPVLVPFAVKLPHANSGLNYAPVVSTLAFRRIADLLLADSADQAALLNLLEEAAREVEAH